MERKKSILLIMGTVVTVLVVLAAFYFLILWGTHIDKWCHSTVNLHHPVFVGENVWMVEIENVDIAGGCPSSLDHFGVFLAQEELVILTTNQLQNGLTAQADPILIFFADEGKVGSVDLGDTFYLVNLEPESEYDFHVLYEGGSVGHIAVST